MTERVFVWKRAREWVREKVIKDNEITWLCDIPWNGEIERECLFCKLMRESKIYRESACVFERESDIGRYWNTLTLWHTDT